MVGITAPGSPSILLGSCKTSEPSRIVLLPGPLNAKPAAPNPRARIAGSIPREAEQRSVGGFDAGVEDQGEPTYAGNGLGGNNVEILIVGVVPLKHATNIADLGTRDEAHRQSGQPTTPLTEKIDLAVKSVELTAPQSDLERQCRHSGEYFRYTRTRSG